MYLEDIEKVFDERKNDNKYNTSYPLSPSDWKMYEVNGDLKFDDSKLMSLYIHIPFCTSLCKFCEYTRIKVPDKKVIDKYLDTLESDVDKFIKSHNIKLCGFDIGGGTPTSLPDEEFKRLLCIYKSTYARCEFVSNDYTPSIESTFQSISESKIDMISSYGIKRISFGFQSCNKKLMNNLNRKSNSLSVSEMKHVIDYCKSKGLIVNLDLMYGINKKSLSYEDLLKEVSDNCKIIKELNPDNVTLYEFRPNMSRYSIKVNKDSLFLYYFTYFQFFKSMKYKSKYGMNTFTKLKDLGLSSYLRHRMRKGDQYKGFGISAQSMSNNGLVYNVGKGLGENEILNLINRLGTYESKSYYKLPSREVFNKFIAISAYSGSVYIPTANKILKDDFLEKFKEEIEFLKGKRYITIYNNELSVTRIGHEFYGAIFSLFYKDFI